MKLVLPIVCIALGCAGAPPAPEPSAVQSARKTDLAPTSCQAGFVGHLISEAVNVAINGSTIFWHEYNFGKIESRAIEGGPPTVVVPHHEEEHHSERMRLHRKRLYWTSKADGALYSVAVDGSGREKLADIPGGPTEFIIHNDRAFVLNLDDVVHVLDLKTGAQTKVEAGRVNTMSASGGAVFLATKAGIMRLASPDYAKPTLWAAPKQDVSEILTTQDHVYWTGEKAGAGRVEFSSRPLAGGEVATVSEPAIGVTPALVEHAGRVLLANGNLVYAFQGGALVPVLVAPSDVIDMASDGKRLVLGSMMGSVHLACPSRTPVTLAKRSQYDAFECPAGLVIEKREHAVSCRDPAGRGVGPSIEFFKSGHLKSTRGVDKKTGLALRVSYYADGKIESRTLGGWENTLESDQYYANGQLAWKIRRNAEGKKITQGFHVDGRPREASE